MDYSAKQYASYVWFIRNVMGIDTIVLPDDSPIIAYTLEIAVTTVNQVLACVVPPLYEQALNNLAGDFLINWAQDQTGQTFFADLRKAYSINNFAAGVVQSTSDEGTSVGLLVPEWAKNLTIANLGNLKTPFGRTYLGIAQAYGSTIWGLT